MTQYDYEKEVVCKVGLLYEVRDSEISSAEVTNITWCAPNALAIIFDGDLSAGDKTILDGVVTAHDGTATNAPKETYNILTSPDGTEWAVTVNDYGVLSTEEVA